MVYVYKHIARQWVIEDENGNVIGTVPTGTVVDTPQGRCRLGENGQKEYVSRNPPDIDRVVRNLWNEENAQNKGYNPDLGLYFPFRSTAGRTDIGCGLDLGKNKQYLAEAQEGITKERAESIARSMIEPNMAKIEKAFGPIH